jgi:hypothetical protein
MRKTRALISSGLVILVAGLLVIGSIGSAAADWKLDIGYTALQAELGSALPTGAGVKVTQVEAAGKPDPLNAQFTGDTFTDKSPSLTIDGHATGVGQIFYGHSSSLAPGITQINCYTNVDWLYYFLNGPGVPLVSNSRVANHSWVGSSSPGTVVSMLSRLDWVVNRDEYIQVVAMNNGSVNVPYMGTSFNAIAVGLSNGTAARGSYPLATTPTTPYALTGRTRPDLVAPDFYTSSATPMVASAAAVLVAEGHQAGTTLSTDPVATFTTNRNGDTIYNSERSEVVKAALMAGASRNATQLATTYAVNTANGLNSVYGAGQLNINNSYHIIAAGEQNSREDFFSGGGEIKSVGFDYDPAFGGLNGSNKTGSYVFMALTTGSLTASLVWNLNVTGETAGGFDTSATLYHLGLYLYDMTSSSEVAYAASLVDNTQNISTGLTANHAYSLEVTSLQATDFLWDYSLAWNITATTTHAPLPSTVILLGSGILAIVLLRRKTQVASPMN